MWATALARRRDGVAREKVARSEWRARHDGQGRVSGVVGTRLALFGAAGLFWLGVGCEAADPVEDSGAEASEGAGVEATDGESAATGGDAGEGDEGDAGDGPGPDEATDAGDGSGSDDGSDDDSDDDSDAGSDAGSDDGGEPGEQTLPDDPVIFGPKVMAMYIFREPYVTTQGAPPVVTSVVNAADPGTHDAVFADPESRPLWIAECGQDVDGQWYGCARFDGVDDFGVGEGFEIVTGDRPSLLLVAQMNEIPQGTAVPFQLTNDDDSRFMNLPEVTTDGWRYNGHYTSTPHNIDFGPADLDLHLHESHLASPATLAVFDGTVRPETGGDSALNGPITRVSLGRHAPVRYAACDVYEALVVDQPTLDEAQAYRDLRIAPQYPTIPLP